MPRSTNPKHHDKSKWAERRALCVELPLMRDRLLKAELFETMHAMDKAVVRIGYEMERLLTKEMRQLKKKSNSGRKD